VQIVSLFNQLWSIFY